MKNVTFDSIGSGLERLAVRVMPGHRPPLLAAQSQGLSVHTVMFTIVERVGEGDVKAVEPVPRSYAIGMAMRIS